MNPNSILIDFQNKLRSLTMVYNNLDTKINTTSKLFDEKVKDFESKFSIDEIHSKIEEIRKDLEGFKSNYSSEDFKNKIDELSKEIEIMRVENELKSKSVPMDPIGMSSAFGTINNSELKQFDKIQNRLTDNELRSNIIENKISDLDSKIQSKLINDQLSSRNELSKMKNELNQKINDLNDKLEKTPRTFEDNSSLELKISDKFHNELKSMRNDINNLEIKLQEKNNEIESLKNKLEESNQELSSSKGLELKLTDKFHLDLKNLENQLHEKNNEIQTLKDKIEDTPRKISDQFNEKINNLEKINPLTLDNLELKINNKLSEIDHSTAKISDLTEFENKIITSRDISMKEFTSKLEEIINSNSILKSNYENLNNKYLDLKNNYEKLNNSDNNDSIVKINSKLDKLKKSVKTKKDSDEIVRNLSGDHSLIKCQVDNILHKLERSDEKINDFSELIKTIISMQKSEDVNLILQSEIVKNCMRSIRSGELNGKTVLDLKISDVFFMKDKSTYISANNLAKNKVCFPENLLVPNQNINSSKKYLISEISYDKLSKSFIFVKSPDNAGIKFDIDDSEWIDMITPFYNPISKLETEKPSETYSEIVLNPDNQTNVLDLTINSLLMDPIHSLTQMNTMQINKFLNEISNIRKKKPEFKYIDKHFEKSGKITTILYPFRILHYLNYLEFEYSGKLDIKDLNLLINDEDVINKYSLLHENSSYILKSKSKEGVLFDNVRPNSSAPLTFCIKNKGNMIDVNWKQISGKIPKIKLTIDDSLDKRIVDYSNLISGKYSFNLLESNKQIFGSKIKDINIEFTVIYHNLNLFSDLNNDEITNCITGIESSTPMKYKWIKESMNIQKSDIDVKLTGIINIKPEKFSDVFQNIDIEYQLPPVLPSFITIIISNLNVLTEGFIKPF